MYRSVLQHLISQLNFFRWRKLGIDKKMYISDYTNITSDTRTKITQCLSSEKILQNSICKPVKNDIKN